jgi:hypothetical protein
MGFNSVIIGPSLLCVLALIIVISVLTRREVPLISGERKAFIALTIINYAMCAVGPLPRTKPGEWLNPINIALYIIGIFAILLIVVVIMANRTPTSFFMTYRKGLILLSIIIFIKWSLFYVQFTTINTT